MECQAGDIASIYLPDGFEGPETDSLFVCGKEGMHGLASAQLEDAGEGRGVDGWRDECFNWSSCSFDKVFQRHPSIQGMVYGIVYRA